MIISEGVYLYDDDHRNEDWSKMGVREIKKAGGENPGLPPSVKV
jgi:hypothetical protein